MHETIKLKFWRGSEQRVLWLLNIIKNETVLGVNFDMLTKVKRGWWFIEYDLNIISKTDDAVVFKATLSVICDALHRYRTAEDKRRILMFDTIT